MSPAGQASSRRKSLRVVVTAGPTREHVDPVRFLSNESSGQMGFAIAEAAAKAGHKVTLIAGPVHLDTPKGVKRVDVVSARDMHAALKEAFAKADALFMAAAVADFRPKRKLRGKWKKKEDGKDDAVLELVKNPDLLASVARRKGDRCVIGFALETSHGLRRAQEKLIRKNADYIVLNDASALNAKTNSVIVIDAGGEALRVTNKSKRDVAKALVGLL